MENQTSTEQHNETEEMYGIAAIGSGIITLGIAIVAIGDALGWSLLVFLMVVPLWCQLAVAALCHYRRL